MIVLVALCAAITACRPERPPPKEIKPLAALPKDSDDASPAPVPPADADANPSDGSADRFAIEPIVVKVGASGPALLDLPAPANASAEGSAPPSDNLAYLTGALKNFVQIRKYVPKSLNELVSAGVISEVPPPPAGRQYEIVKEPLEIRLK